MYAEGNICCFCCDQSRPSVRRNIRTKLLFLLLKCIASSYTGRHIQAAKGHGLLHQLASLFDFMLLLTELCVNFRQEPCDTISTYSSLQMLPYLLRLPEAVRIKPNGVPAEMSAQLHDLVESHSRGATPRASSSEMASNQNGPAFGTAGDSQAVEPDLDRDLEAYLQTMEHEKEKDSSENKADASSSESAADLDEYLNELQEESEKEDSEGAEEEPVDVETYIQNDS